jgi:hypothetical protein
MNALQAVKFIASNASTSDFINWVESGCKSKYWESSKVYHEDPRFKGYFFEIVSSEGGGEGSGENVERVIEVTAGDAVIGYVEINGSYQSYNGTEWDDSEDFEQVYPVVRPTTYYLTNAYLSQEEKAQHGLK